MPKAAQHQDAAAARFELETTIRAPRDHVWRLVTERPDDWWIADLRCVAGDSRMSFEPRAGGTLVETGAAGASLLWFTVLAVTPGRSLNLAGCLAPPFGGPCQTYLLIELEGDGPTTVRMTHSMHGVVDEGALRDMTGGWQLLLDQGLRALAEETAAS